MFISAGSFSGAPDIDYNPLVAMGATGVIQATYNGGIPPYAVSMKFTEANQPATELFDNNKGQGAFNPAYAPGCAPRGASENAKARLFGRFQRRRRSAELSFDEGRDASTGLCGKLCIFCLGQDANQRFRARRAH